MMTGRGTSRNESGPYISESAKSAPTISPDQLESRVANSRAARPPGMSCVRIFDFGNSGSVIPMIPGMNMMRAPVHSHQPQPTMSPIMTVKTTYLNTSEIHG